MAFIDKDNLTIVKRKKRKEQKELVRVIVSVKMIVEASEAKAGAPIAPILGQFQINALEFCKKFNEMSSDYEEGLPLLVKVLKKNDGKVEINIKSPIMEYIVWIFLNEGENQELNIEELYDIVLIKAKLIKQNDFVLLAKKVLKVVSRNIIIRI